MSTQPKKQPLPAEWTVQDAVYLYRISSWGDPFFFVNPTGHMAVRALDEAGTTMDVVAIVSELRRRGVPDRDRRGELRQHLSRHLPDQGEPAPRGRRRATRRRAAVWHGSRVRVEGRADRRAAADRRRHAARLQRRERPHDAVAGDRWPEAWPEHR